MTLLDLMPCRALDNGYCGAQAYAAIKGKSAQFSGYFYYLLCLRPLFTISNRKLYTFAFLQRPVAIAANLAVMYENIPTTLAFDESKTFGIIEPLHGAVLTI